MFTIKWRDTIYGYEHMVTFDDGWKRLNCCNAATFKRTFTDTKGNVYACHYLQSYATPILYVVKVKNKYGILKDVRIYVNESMWDCSRTTISHIAKYCTNLLFFEDVPIDYYTIKDGMKYLEKNQTELEYKAQDRVYVVADTDSELRNLFVGSCPRTF